MKHDIAHDLDIELAKLAARKAAEAYGKRFAEYDYRAKWTSDTRLQLSFAVKGIRLEGVMLVEARKLVLEMDVPFLLRVFQGKALEIIEREANVWLAKAKRGELSE